MKGSENSLDWAGLYKQAYNVTYQALPSWKRLEVDTNPGGRTHIEFCKEVIKAAETSPGEFTHTDTDSSGFSGKYVPDPHILE